MIQPDTIQKILDASRIEEVVGEFVTLKRRGVNLLGLCPFHNEKTPSFTVSPAKGIYKCFGCGKGGDSVHFIMEHEHFNYPEALKYLAKKYNIEVEEEKPSPEMLEAMNEKESLYNLNEFAKKYFSDILHTHEEGKSVGLSYFRERGFSPEIIEKFQLGYCLNSWDAFSLHARKNGYKNDYLEKTGLSKSRDNQGLYDTYRGRVMFPILSLSGRVLGFGGRILTSDKTKPKYINSPESDIYHKGKILYGIYFAKNAIVAKDNCCLVEGYTDVISLHQAGIENVVASSGTSLTTEQIKLIRRYTQNITLLFDGDPAGIKAAFRGTDMILEEGMNVRIVLFPDGEDPDSYSRKYRPAEVQDFINTHSEDFISFKTNLLLSETGNDPIKKAGLIREIAQSIAIIPDPISRTLFTQKCSQMMQVDEKIMVEEISRIRRKKATSEKDKGSETAASSNSLPPLVEPQPQTKLISSEPQEKDFIRLLILYGNQDIIFTGLDELNHEVEYTEKVAVFMINDILGDEISFSNAVYQEIFNIFSKEIENSQIPETDIFTHHQNDQIRMAVIDILSQSYELSPNWFTKHGIEVASEVNSLKKVVIDCINALKLRTIEIRLKELDEKLQNKTDDEEIILILQQKIEFEKIKKLLAGELKRIVIR